MDRIWSDADRERQAAVLLREKIWEQSTGPKTYEGKEISKMNALKHGLRSEAFKAFKQVLKDQRKWIEEVNNNI